MERARSRGRCVAQKWFGNEHAKAKGCLLSLCTPLRFAQRWRREEFLSHGGQNKEHRSIKTWNKARILTDVSRNMFRRCQIAWPDGCRADKNRCMVGKRLQQKYRVVVRQDWVTSSGAKMAACGLKFDASTLLSLGQTTEEMLRRKFFLHGT